MSTMVTKAAIITINEGIRILSGMLLATNEITRLDITSTNAVASPIPIPLMADVVTPSVGHIPNKSTKVGFSLNNPRVKFDKLLIFQIYNVRIYHSVKEKQTPYY